MKLKWCGGGDRVWGFPDAFDGEKEEKEHEEEDMLGKWYRVQEDEETKNEAEAMGGFLGLDGNTAAFLEDEEAAGVEENPEQEVAESAKQTITEEDDAKA